MPRLCLAALLCLLLAPPSGDARGGACYACSHRSSSARAEFKVRSGYPHGRPGYVIDHVVPLKRGGADAPRNMQWQTIEAAKAKDKWE
jgi:hypothetical protein